MSHMVGYEILEELFDSHRALVYRAKRQSDDLPVILKVLKEVYPTSEQIAWFKREYEITRQLPPSLVAKIYSLERYQNNWMMVIEDFGGESLARLQLMGQLEVSRFLHLAIKLADSLAEIHQYHIIHKDINPANIVLNPQTGEVKIIDFGIATVLSQENPEFYSPNLLEGTLAYIAPEQTGRMNRPVDYRSDFYSLGVTFYELLTGQLPFKYTDRMELVYSHLTKPPTPPRQIKAEIPEMLSQIVLKLLAKDAQARYQSSYGLKADLERCLQAWQAESHIPSFLLGSDDISSRFQISQKLYGRETELAHLLTTFERILQGEHELTLVSGPAGIGKSALIKELYQIITQHRGYFISGKFNQFQRNIPYSAIVSTFQLLVRQLLAESQTQLTQWREKLTTALAPNAQLIIEVIPEIELIMGAQPAVPELGLVESQNRFNWVFQNFVSVFGQIEHPLIMFLDDLQWADSASLKLLELILLNQDISALFLLGAYRDDEIEATHPLRQTLETVKQAGVIINQLTLQPLALNHITQLVADTLQTGAAQVSPLAELIQQKTAGNPFFVSEFLKTLHQQNLLTFITANNGHRTGWHWDMAQLEALNMTANVVTLVIDKLKTLPTETQQLLQLAACIGDNFDLQTVALIEQKPVDMLFNHLLVAVEQNLIQANSELASVQVGEETQLLVLHYKFVHDRVQQAAYNLLSPDQRKAIHWQIGQLLLAHTTPENRENQLFNLLEHLNLGFDLATHEAHKIELAQLNLWAGQKAKAAMAYQPASVYLRRGLELLEGTDSWHNHYNLRLALCTEAIEADYFNAEAEAAQPLLQEVLTEAQNLLEKVRVYELHMQFYLAQNQQLEALQTALEVLALLGVVFPSQPAEIGPYIMKLRQKLVAGVTDIAHLATLPEMNDPQQLAIMRILVQSTSLALHVKPPLLPMIVFTMVERSLEYGNSAYAAYGYGFYAVILCGQLADLTAGYQFGQLAFQILDQFKAKHLHAKVSATFNVFVRHCHEHLRESLEPLRLAHQSGVESGDLEYGFYNAVHYGSYSFFVGQPLEVVWQQQGQYLIQMAKFKQTFHLAMTHIWQQTVLNLQGNVAQPQQLVGELMDETTLIPKWLAQHNFTLLFFAYCSKTVLAYIFKEYGEAVAAAALGEEYAKGAMGMLYGYEHNFYQSLSLLAHMSPENEATTLEKVATNQKKMQLWATHAPMNFQHKFDLIEAEKARLAHDPLRAMELYDQAIAGARDYGYIHEEALGYERAGEFYLALGRAEIGQHYLVQAHHRYRLWGATGKAQAIISQHPDLLLRIRNNMPTTLRTVTMGKSTRLSDHLLSTSTYQHSSSSETESVSLDLETVFKAAYTISGEIELAQLLTKLMKIIMANAGAECGLLLLEQHGQWFIEAEGTPDIIQIWQQTKPLNRQQTTPDLPLELINYVTRTQSSLVLDEATASPEFAQTLYVQTHRPKSILCVPLTSSGRMVGLVYLENNLMTYAFTPERVKIVSLLGTQAAISITNVQAIAAQAEQARLRIEKAFYERHAEELAQLNADKDKFFSIVAHDLKGPFMPLLGYSEYLLEIAEAETNEELLEIGQVINSTAKNIFALLENLLQWARLQMGRMEYQASSITLSTIVQQTVQLLKPTADQKKITLSSTLPTHLVAKADESMTYTVIRNLTNNALKFTPQNGKVTISGREVDSDYLEIAIIDTGIGIKAENLGKLFKIQTAFTTAGTAQEKGTGLGLIMCREMVELNGGKIWVESELGQGTTVKFTLPRYLAED